MPKPSDADEVWRKSYDAGLNEIRSVTVGGPSTATSEPKPFAADEIIRRIFDGTDSIRIIAS